MRVSYDQLFSKSTKERRITKLLYNQKKKYKLRNQDSTTHAILYSNTQKVYCLPYSPPEKAILYWRRCIKPGFLKVTGSIGKKIKEFVTYINTRWFMSYSGYSPSMMSIYSLDVTTTNSCEGFHSKLKRCLIMTKKEKVDDVIEGLKMMELRISSEYLREGLYGGEGEKSIKNKALYQLYCCFQFNEKNLDEYAAEITKIRTIKKLLSFSIVFVFCLLFSFFYANKFCQ